MLPSRWSGASGAALRNALLISAALHLIVFVLVSPSEREGRDAGAIPKPLRALSVSTKRGPLPLSAAPSAAGGVPKVLPAPRPPALAIPDTAPGPGPAIPAATMPAVASEPVASVAASTASASGESTVPPEVAMPLHAGTAADSHRDAESSETYAEALRSYRIALASHVKRFYPPQAEEMGLGGRCEVEVVLRPSAVPELRIKRTSGHDLLDQAALKMLRRSVASVELPPALKARRFGFTLPVQFDPQP